MGGVGEPATLSQNCPGSQDWSTMRMPSDGSEIRLTSSYGKYPIIYRVLYIPGGAGFLPWTESIIVKKVEHM